MRHTFITAVTVAVIATVLLAFHARGALGVIYPVTPYDTDVNKDGKVNSVDQLSVAKNFGKPVVAESAAALSTYSVTATLGSCVVSPCTVTAFCDSGDPVTGAVWTISPVILPTTPHQL